MPRWRALTKPGAVGFLCLLFLLHICAADSDDQQQGGSDVQEEIEATAPLEGPCDAPAWERGLTRTADLTAAELAQGARQYYARGAAAKRFPSSSAGRVLGYVTPWNTGGYDAALCFRAKLDVVAPVWYQLRARGGGGGGGGDDDQGGLELTGGHDANDTWVAALRAPPGDGAACEGDAAEDARDGTCSAAATATTTTTKVMPRVIVELAPQQLVALLLSRPGPAVDAIVAEVTARGYDGVVLEAWAGWASLRGGGGGGGGAMDDPGFRGAALGFVRLLSAGLVMAGGKELILAVPPPLPAHTNRPSLCRPEHLAEVADDVAAFSVMTYDFSGDPSAPGPNAPIGWQEDNARLLLQGAGLAPAQILLGVPFYGYDFTRHVKSGARGVEAVLGSAALAVAARHTSARLAWSSDAAEHSAAYRAGRVAHTVSLPTPAMLEARLQLAERLGCGLSIWELGQGYDALFDLL